MDSSPIAGVPNDVVVGTYDRLAAAYDLVVSPLAAGTRRRALEALDVEAGACVLEVGCGPGHALLAFGERVGPDGHVAGLDAAPAMVDRARRRVDASGLADRVDLLVGDARSLPIPADSVDVVFVEDTLELFSRGEITAVVDECARVLDTDGRLGVVTMERSGLEDDRFLRAYEWAFEHIPGVCRVGCRPIYAHRALEEGGFAVVLQERHRRGHVWPTEILIARPG